MALVSLSLGKLGVLGEWSVHSWGLNCTSLSSLHPVNPLYVLLDTRGTEAEEKSGTTHG